MGIQTFFEHDGVRYLVTNRLRVYECIDGERILQQHGVAPPLLQGGEAREIWFPVPLVIEQPNELRN